MEEDSEYDYMLSGSNSPGFNDQSEQYIPKWAQYQIDVWEQVKIDDQCLGVCDTWSSTVYSTMLQEEQDDENVMEEQVAEIASTIIDEYDPQDAEIEDQSEALPPPPQISPSLINPNQWAVDLEHERMLNYNIEHVDKALEMIKIPGQSKFAQPFMSRFKSKLINVLNQKMGDQQTNINDLNKVEGMSDPSMTKMIDVLKLKDILGTGVNLRDVAERYTSSNEILLDGIFPVLTKNGKLREKGLQKKYQLAFNRFLPSYEIISKLIDCSEQQETEQLETEQLKIKLTFQDCRYFYGVTDREYNPFWMQR